MVTFWVGGLPAGVSASVVVCGDKERCLFILLLSASMCIGVVTFSVCSGLGGASSRNTMVLLFAAPNVGCVERGTFWEAFIKA